MRDERSWPLRGGNLDEALADVVGHGLVAELRFDFEKPSKVLDLSTKDLGLMLSSSEEQAGEVQATLRLWDEDPDKFDKSMDLTLNESGPARIVNKPPFRIDVAER